MVKFNPTGSDLVYATFLGGSDLDDSRAIALDGMGHAYLMGETESNNFPTTPGAFDRSFNGYTDAFVAKLTMRDPMPDRQYLPLILGDAR